MSKVPKDVFKCEGPLVSVEAVQAGKIVALEEKLNKVVNMFDEDLDKVDQARLLDVKDLYTFLNETDSSLLKLTNLTGKKVNAIYWALGAQAVAYLVLAAAVVYQFIK